MSARRIVEVVAAVIENDGRILACRRRPEKAAGGKWEFPGGKIEPDETPTQAIIREIAEELNVQIEVLGQLRQDDTDVSGTIIRLACFRASLTGVPPTHSSDHDELRWMRVSELSSLDWAAPDLPAVAELVRAPRN
ncbi:(deoxy)nucleoside triphosphate pyrophosphohydrolase [Microbacterium sp. NPDC089696]|uniref:(deoxy)nucleoside triphosphate pyrophosphohydrolase n=1 Tax=Microbacterium sp. NPDC089696 TaxID=3364199 RepID=UPI00381F18B8